MFTLEDLHIARTIVAEAMPPTPQCRWPLLAEATGCEVWVKHENHTPTGSRCMDDQDVSTPASEK